jgi:hypothetical protein
MARWVWVCGTRLLLHNASLQSTPTVPHLLVRMVVLVLMLVAEVAVLVSVVLML